MLSELLFRLLWHISYSQLVMGTVDALHHYAVDTQGKFMLYHLLFLDPVQGQFSRNNNLRSSQGKRRGIESYKEKE